VQIIDRAKKYAKTHNMSLSKLIESYLDNVTSHEQIKHKLPITPLVDSLSGVIDLPQDFDYKNEYRNHIEKKYS
jgi:hypothetical protein